MRYTKHLLILLWFFYIPNLIQAQTSSDSIVCDILVDAGWDLFIGGDAPYLSLTGSGSSAMTGSGACVMTGSGASVMTGSGTCADTYLWTTHDGHILNGENTTTVNVTTAGSYVFTISNEHCSASDTVNVFDQMNEGCSSLPIFEIHDTTYCKTPIDVCLNVTTSDLEHAILKINDDVYNGDIQICEDTLEQIQLELSAGFHSITLIDTFSGCLTFKTNVYIENDETPCRNEIATNTLSQLEKEERENIRQNSKVKMVENFSNLNHQKRFTNSHNFLQCFPNPAQDYLTIKMAFPSEENNLMLQLLDVNGRSLQQVEINQTKDFIQLDLQDVATGIYIVQIQGQSNIWSKKVMVNK